MNISYSLEQLHEELLRYEVLFGGREFAFSLMIKSCPVYRLFRFLGVVSPDTMFWAYQRLASVRLVYWDSGWLLPVSLNYYKVWLKNNKLMVSLARINLQLLRKTNFSIGSGFFVGRDDPYKWDCLHLSLTWCYCGDGGTALNKTSMARSKTHVILRILRDFGL